MAKGYVWVQDPDAGGVKITDALKRDTERRLRSHADKHYAGKFTRLGIKFRGQFCYIEAFKEPDPAARPYEGSGETLDEYRERLRNTPFKLCRLRHCGQGKWSVGFFKYSDMNYELCILASGDFYGTPEEGFDVGAVYLE